MRMTRSISVVAFDKSFFSVTSVQSGVMFKNKRNKYIANTSPLTFPPSTPSILSNHSPFLPLGIDWPSAQEQSVLDNTQNQTKRKIWTSQTAANQKRVFTSRDVGINRFYNNQSFITSQFHKRKSFHNWKNYDIQLWCPVSWKSRYLCVRRAVKSLWVMFCVC